MLRTLTLASGLLLCAPALATAQTTAATPTTPVPSAGWSDGFFLQSPDGDNRLTLGLVGQMDGKFAFGDPPPITNTFLIRKARPIFAGRVARYFEFRLMPDFAGGTSTLFDAYMDLRLSTPFRIRTGKDKTPVGYEALLGDPSLPFPERSLTSNLVPNRDVGVQLLGDLAGAKVTYSGGVFNGVPDGTSSTTDADANSGKDLAGRLLLQPFRAKTAIAGHRTDWDSRSADRPDVRPARCRPSRPRSARRFFPIQAPRPTVGAIASRRQSSTTTGPWAPMVSSSRSPSA